MVRHVWGKNQNLFRITLPTGIFKKVIHKILIDIVGTAFDKIGILSSGIKATTSNFELLIKTPQLTISHLIKISLWLCLSC